MTVTKEWIPDANLKHLVRKQLNLPDEVPLIPFLVIYHSYVAQTVSLCPIPPHFVKFGNATSFFRIGITQQDILYSALLISDFGIYFSNLRGPYIE